MRFLLFICCLFTWISADAQWYQAKGKAVVMQGNTSAAKAKATENALKKALLVAGASVSSIQQVVNGLLTQDAIDIRATGTVNSFEIIDEIHSNDIITVTIRADIIGKMRQCFSADYRKSLLLARSHIKEREQANVGGIYALDDSFVNQLSRKIKDSGLYLSPKLSVKSSTAFSRYNQSFDSEKIKHIAMSLSQMTDSQYILFSEIEDLSFSNEANNSWKIWQADKFDRYFAVSVYLYNGNDGEQMFHKRYQSLAPWTFDKREQVDVRSTSFWQSEYGMSIDSTLDIILADIDDYMMCQPTRARIVQVSGNSMLFNLGSNHGVKVGDKFSLLHQSHFTSDQGTLYPGYNVSDTQVTVTRVAGNSAFASSSDGQIIDSIQIDDLVVRY